MQKIRKKNTTLVFTRVVNEFTKYRANGLEKKEKDEREREKGKSLHQDEQVEKINQQKEKKKSKPRYPHRDLQVERVTHTRSKNVCHSHSLNLTFHISLAFCDCTEKKMVLMQRINLLS